MWNDTRGVAAVEYALLAGLVAVALIASLAQTGSNLSGSMDRVNHVQRIEAGSRS